ncbi:MAG: formate dehydrogenase accessory protein FdhE [Dehalococcoidia bacterium]
MSQDTNSKILEKLSAMEKEEGKLPLLLEFYRGLLQAQSKAHKPATPTGLSLSSDAIQQHMLKGLPLVSFDDLVLDWPSVQNMFTKVVAVFTRYPELFGEIASSMKEPEAGRLLTRKAAKAWFTGKVLPQELLEGVRENLIQTIIQATFQPFLTDYSRALIKSVDQDNWRRGYCPICGGNPDMAFLEKEIGARWLMCSRCDFQWLFQRLECHCCGNREQKFLSFLADDTEQYRLYACEQCKSYLKAVDLRKTDDEVLLPLERLNTLDLDSQAKSYGYQPCQRPE